MTGELHASPTGYAAAGAANTPPPPITPTPVASSGSIVDNLLAALGTAANIGVPADNIDARSGQAERAAKTADAAAKFPANEEDSAAQLAALPQLASGIAGAIVGALGGALQPLSQVPQQAAQAGQQAMQMGMGRLQQGNSAMDADVVPDDAFGTDGGAGELFGGSGFDGTAPAALLAPPSIPSAGTVSASSPPMPAAAPSPPETPTAPRAGTGAMPMTPPGAMHGASGSTGEPKPDTKRVVVPSVRNGAPVQGRITTPLPEVTKRLAGKPIATRHIVADDAER